MTDRNDPPRSPLPGPGLVDALLGALAGNPAALDLLGPDDRAAADDLQPWLALLVEHGPDDNDRDVLTAMPALDLPDLADDPVAVALGLVPDPTRPLSADALTRARKARGLRPTDVKAALIARGWEVSTAELARAERADTLQPPALLAALAAILGVDPGVLAPPREVVEPDWLTETLSDERIAEVLQQWAAEEQVPVEQLRREVSGALVGAGYRNQQAPTVEALLAVITVLREVRRSRRPQ